MNHKQLEVVHPEISRRQLWCILQKSTPSNSDYFFWSVLSPGAGLSKYRHQASHRNCAGTPSTLFGCFQPDPPSTPVLRETPLQSFIVYTLVTPSTPSPESCTIINMLPVSEISKWSSPFCIIFYFGKRPFLYVWYQTPSIKFMSCSYM